MSQFTLHRAPDWPPDAHIAASEFERAVNALCKAEDADQMEAGVRRLRNAKDRLGRALLRLDMARRPEAYRRDPVA